MGADAGVLLVAEDDDDDFLLTQEALRDSGFGGSLARVRDGEELLDYLFRRGAYLDPLLSPEPRLILLDLNMPRKDGRGALREIKAHPVLPRVPALILSASRSRD